jgi:flagellar biosynthetic protein FliR
MGLGFAVFFDPQSAAQTAVVGQFLGLFAMLLFLSMNGHALVITALAESFQVLPITAGPLNALGWQVLVGWGGAIFSTGLLISLPVVAALLIANVAVGIMTRAAPQLNIFAVGFPVTLVTGFVALYLATPYIAPGLAQLFEQVATVMMRVAQDLRPALP